MGTHTGASRIALALVAFVSGAAGCSSDRFSAASGGADGGPVDVVTDGSAPVDASSSFCATQDSGSFCDDFDQGEPLGARWDSNSPTSPGLSLDDVSASPPRALHVLVAPNGPVVALRRTAQGVSADAGVSVALEVRVDSLADYEAALVLVEYIPSSTGETFEVSLNLAQPSVDEALQGNNGSLRHHLLDPLPNILGRYVHVVFQVDPAQKMAHVRIDGKGADVPLENGPSASVVDRRVSVGAAYVGSPNSAFDAHVDNVVITP